MDIYLQLLQIYQSYGINIKTGLYPWHFPIESNEEFLYSKTRFPFTDMVVDNNLLGSGGGIHIMEIFIIASLSSMIKSKKSLLLETHLVGVQLH